MGIVVLPDEDDDYAERDIDTDTRLCPSSGLEYRFCGPCNNEECWICREGIDVNGFHFNTPFKYCDHDVIDRHGD